MHSGAEIWLLSESMIFVNKIRYNPLTHKNPEIRLCVVDIRCTLMLFLNSILHILLNIRFS